MGQAFGLWTRHAVQKLKSASQRSTERPEIGVRRNPRWSDRLSPYGILYQQLKQFLPRVRAVPLVRPRRNSIVWRVFAYTPLGGQISHNWLNVPTLSASLVLRCA